MEKIRRYRNKGNEGASTVEACFVMPIFLFFFLFIASVIMIYFADCHIHQGLSEAGEYTSAYCYYEASLQETANDKSIQNLTAVNEAVFLKEFLSHIKDDFFVNRIIKGGAKGIQILVIPDKENPKIFHGVAVYKVKFYIPIFGEYDLSQYKCTKIKGFVGYTYGEEEVDEYVYVTPNEAVYHCSRNCTHLMLSVHTESVGNRKKYKPCGFCKHAPMGNLIYVARTSNLYHLDKTCSGLKRTVNRVKKSEAGGLPPCSRCGR